MRGVRARYDAVLPPNISIVRHPGRSSHIGLGGSCSPHGHRDTKFRDITLSKRVRVNFGMESGKKRNPNPKFLVRLFSGGVGVFLFTFTGGGHRVRYVPRNIGNQTFGRNIPGFCGDMRPKKSQKKKAWWVFVNGLKWSKVGQSPLWPTWNPFRDFCESPLFSQLNSQRSEGSYF